MKFLLLKLRDFLKLRVYGWVFPERGCFFEKPFDWHCGYGRKITEWQKRELSVCNLEVPEDAPEVPSRWAMWKAQWKAFRHIKYVKEKGDIWLTSEDVKLRRYGDCEDQAFYVMALLRDACKGWDRLGICLVKGHAFAIVKIDGSDFWVIDNGHLSYSIEKASRLLPYHHLQPICGFNLVKKWSYAR